MASLKDMNREDFIELFGMDMSNLDDVETMECIYDEQHENGASWFEIAKNLIGQMDSMIRGM